MTSPNSTNPYDGVHRILVVANETARGSELHDLVSERVHTQGYGEAAVLVLSPALTSRIRHIFSDIDPARQLAELRLCECIERLRRRGIDSAGIVGDGDPMQAMRDVLQTYPADELIISTHVEDRSNWLAHDVVSRARNEFGLPTAHLAVDVERRGAVVLAAA